MNKIEYLIALALVVIGIACLTMSGTYLLDQNITVYAMTFLKICLWIGIPIIIIGLVYFILVKRKRGEKSK
jgi:membrane protein DedA with SNARE-associated domain